MTRSAVLRALLAVAVLSASTSVYADMWGLGLDNVKPPEMKYGAVEAHPYLKLSEVYDSNIFLQPRSKVKGNNANSNTAGPVLGSWIHTINGGVKLGAQLSEMHRLDLSYDFGYKAYSKDPKSNNTFNQGVDFGYGYHGPMGITAHAKDTYINTVDPATSELTQRVRRWQNTAGVDVQYAPEGGAFFGGIDAQDTVHKYVSDPILGRQLNRSEVGVGLKAGYRVMPKTRVYAAYHRQLIHYSAHPARPTKNNKSHLVDIGIEGQIAPKLTGQVQTGFSYRKYDDPASIAANGLPGTNQSRISRNWTLATKLGYRPLERTKVDLSLSRSLQESSFVGNPFYIATAAGINASHQLPWKLALGANLGWEQDKYSQTTITALSGGAAFATVNRRDDLYQAGGSLSYDIQSWLKAGLDYQYRARFSHNLSEQFNYRDHVTGITIAASF